MDEIKKNYKPNFENSYYDDAPEDGMTWQPDVYEYAVAYAKQNNVQSIIDIGSGNGEKLIAYKDDFNITFIDFGLNLEGIKQKFKKSTKAHIYIDQNFEESFPGIKPSIVKNSIVICSDVIEHVRELKYLVNALVVFSKSAKLVMISTPERIRTYGFDQNGIPNNACHVREWSLNEMAEMLKNKGMDFSIGLTRSNDYMNNRASICVLAGLDLMPPNENSSLSSKDYLYPLMPLELISQKNVLPPRLKNHNALFLYNPLKHDYFMNHLTAALRNKTAIRINKFKFLSENGNEQYKKGGIENVDRLLVQYIGTDIIGKSKENIYPVAFTILYNSKVSITKRDALPTLSLASLRVDYLPELLLGFHESFSDHETIPLIADLTKQEALISDLKTVVARNNTLIEGQRSAIESLDKEMNDLIRSPKKYISVFVSKAKSKVTNGK